MSKLRLPRKLKKTIPEGPYCYKITSFNDDMSVSINPCRFYNIIKSSEKPLHLQDEIDKEFPNDKIGFCGFLKNEIDDQCKNCNINFNFKK